MSELTAIDAITEGIALDDRVSPTAVRLYLLLRNGKTLDDAATALGRTTDWLKRYERQLCDLGYLEVHTVRARGQRERRYVFLTPSNPGRLAS
jgi:hypothetical protein